MAPGSFPLPLDPELAEAYKLIPPMDEEKVREFAASAKDIADNDISYADRVIPGFNGDEITVTIFRKKEPAAAAARPCIYHIHGGGMISGNRFLGMQHVLQLVRELDLVAVSVEYRLAPEHPDPTPVEDCYAGLVWTADHAEALGIRPDRILVYGFSAGGGLAAGVTLLARDRRPQGRGGPQILGQALFCPMLDDRGDRASHRQFMDVGLWDGTLNAKAWACLLGGRRGATDGVSIYAAPARATDLSGLPPAYVDVGSCDVFRDEAVAFATGLWRDGVQCELHVWPGGFHGFEGFCPAARLSVEAVCAKRAWIGNLFQMSL
jgi:acetyl esterase/lipase